jgi:hypothetical protein
MPRDRSEAIASGSPPSSAITPSTSLAALPETFLAETIATSFASAAGSTRDSAGSTSPRRASSSPVTQLAIAAGSAPPSAAASASS